MKIRFIKYPLFLILIGLVFNLNAVAQENDADNYKMLYKFKTVKQADNSRLLEVSFIARNKKDRKDKIPVFDAEIKFYNFLDDEEILLGSNKTDKEGFARLTLPEKQTYLVDKFGYMNFKAVFEGTDALDEEEEELSVKDLIFELDLAEIDSIKTVNVKAFSIDSLGNKTHVEDEIDIIISIEGMLSKMKIEEGTLEDGEFEFEFPTNIPGDVNGNILVNSIIEDHDDFGNVIQKKSVNWGVFNKQIKEESNTLWSEAAPIWMYIVLTILLVGVWANYIYTVIHLFKIKKEGKTT